MMKKYPEWHLNSIWNRTLERNSKSAETLIVRAFYLGANDNFMVLSHLSDGFQPNHKSMNFYLKPIHSFEVFIFMPINIRIFSKQVKTWKNALFDAQFYLTVSTHRESESKWNIFNFIVYFCLNKLNPELCFDQWNRSMGILVLFFSARWQILSSFHINSTLQVPILIHVFSCTKNYKRGVKLVCHCIAIKVQNMHQIVEIWYWKLRPLDDV